MLNKALKKWDHFWFSEIDLYNVGLFRLIFGFTIFFMYFSRLQNAEIFYTDKGLLPAAEALEILPEYLRSAAPIYFHSDALNYWAHFVFVVLLFFFAIGAFGRSLTWVLFLLSLGFYQRNFPLVYGADLFSHFWLFSLSFIKHNRHFSVLNLIKGHSPFSSLPDVKSDLFSSSFTRVLQIQLCLSYAYTGVEKLKGLQWWEGSAVWYVVGMPELVAVDLSWLRSLPILINLLSMATVIFEVYFLFAVTNKTLRPYWLLIGVGLHLGIAIFMSLPFFGLVMLAPYVLFLDSQKTRQWLSSRFYLLKKIRTR